MSVSSISQMHHRYTAFVKKFDRPEPQAITTSHTDQASISIAARTALQAEHQVAGKGPLDVPLMSLDPQVHQAQVEKRVKELLKEAGLPESTPVSMTMGSQGELLVDIDHPQGEELEKIFAEDHQLRNDVQGLHGTMALQRIAKAARQVWNNAGDDYTSRLNAVNWIKNFTAETQNMPFSLRYDGSSVQASFEDGKGNVVDHMNNFTVPKTFA